VTLPLEGAPSDMVFRLSFLAAMMMSSKAGGLESDVLMLGSFILGFFFWAALISRVGAVVMIAGAVGECQLLLLIST
jgi:hypothetical protein